MNGPAVEKGVAEIAADEAEEEVAVLLSQGSVEAEALMRTVRDKTEKIMSLRGMLSSDLVMIMNNIQEPGRLADLVGSNLRLKIPEAQSILESFDPVVRLKLVAEYLKDHWGDIEIVHLV